MGSPKIVASNLCLLSGSPPVGIVFPQYYAPLREKIHWGGNYHTVRRLLHECEIDIDNRCPVEFPAGSMFWFTPKAVRPLLNRHLTFADFAPEKGQIDGTMAHAVERAFLYMAEAQELRWVKVCADIDEIGGAPVINVDSSEQIGCQINKVWRSVLKKYESA